jgi:hypothetical protein
MAQRWIVRLIEARRVTLHDVEDASYAAMSGVPWMGRNRSSPGLLELRLDLISRKRPPTRDALYSLPWGIPRPGGQL